MPLIVDSSVAVSWIIPDEKSPVGQAILDQAYDFGLILPRLWRYEVRNVLLTQERRKRITEAQIVSGLELLESLFISFDDAGTESDLFRLARLHKLTGYDVAYLELALREDLSLATFDKALIAAAKNEGVTLLA